MIKPILIKIQVISLVFLLQACTNHQQAKQKPVEVSHTHGPVNSASNSSIPSNSGTARTQKPLPRRHSTPPKKYKAEPRSFNVQVNPAQIVSAHNRVRSKYRLQPLSWSPSLSKFSAQWANHLKRNNGCRMHHRPHEGQNKTDYGENLFWASPFRWSDGATNIQNISSTAVVQAWAEEVKYYNYSRNSCQRGQQCGHFTQVVWKDSRKVGCALAICPDKSQVWVCSYDPPGNWQGIKPY